MSLPPVFPRGRSKSVHTPSYWHSKTSGSDIAVPIEADYEAPGTLLTKSIEDQNNGNWRKSRSIVMAPCRIVETARDVGGAMSMALSENWVDGVTHQPKYKLTEYTGDFCSGGFENSINTLFSGDANLELDLPAMKTVAFAKACAKVNASEVCSGEALHDLNQTVAMLRRPFGGATKLLKNIFKAKKHFLSKAGSNAAKAGSQAWLEYRYGWQPLLMDADSIIQMILGKRELGGKVLVARAEESRSYSPSKPFSFGTTTDPQWYRDGTACRSQTARACAGVMYELKNRTTSEMLAAMLGTRARDIPATLWEIIPFSFVIDWFTNVGTWIQAITPDPDIVRKGAWVSTIYVSRTSHNGVFHYSSGPLPGTSNVYTRTSASLNKSSWTTRKYERDVDPDVGAFPVLTGKPLSMLHSIDGASLTIQKILSSMKTIHH